ncbi:MAG TPA: potassium channel protein [Candidatus Binataceae bacterium]|nr:potassium channel protein [Candidatus Binataceae bacterium]
MNSAQALSPTRRVAAGVAVVAVLTMVATAGYMVIERMSFIDALYMTVITITTVGYEEVRPLDTAGRLYTIAVIFTGVGTAYYMFAVVTQVVVGGQLRELAGKNTMNRKIQQVAGHVIVCGYGRFGRVVADQLKRDKLTVVVVERDAEREPDLIQADFLYVIGSAIDVSILDRAGIERASDIVVATASDPDNVFISLSARDRNPRIHIHARADTEAGLRHLELAGADQVISSHHYSALRIAAAIARPSIVDFLTLVLPGHSEDVSLEEVTIGATSALGRQTIAQIERANTRLRIVGLKRGAGALTIVPDSDTRIEAGDLIVVIGARPSLERLAETAAA